MGVAVGIFFLGIIGAKIRWGGNFTPPPVGHIKVAKNLVPAKVNKAFDSVNYWQLF